MFPFWNKSRFKRPNISKPQVPVQRVKSEFPIAIQHMCCRIKHPALRWIITNSFEIFAVSISSSTVHFVHISVKDKTVNVTFPAASGRVQFWSHSSLFQYTSVYVTIFFAHWQNKILKKFFL
jgi:hypothetical protein